MFQPLFKVYDLIALRVQTMAKFKRLIGQVLMPVVGHPQ